MRILARVRLEFKVYYINKMQILLIFFLCSSFTGCYIFWHEWAPVPSIVVKCVAEKPVPMDTEGPHNLDSPRYYLVADDGTYVEVGPTTFSHVQIGEPYASREWRGKAVAGKSSGPSFRTRRMPSVRKWPMTLLEGRRKKHLQ